ncbi:hypothetical protein E4T38_05138 [Aureobasidium subglaciale]|nr:hypothetical protein E4T38_05138 [Aureobasidium subglaciale]KAI5222021.1 hypothetical protein E4T40_05176 [Aureobasidium subglaciale]KAI5225957.1 hypothetical protein E4T41_04995 [Aureobasidium subglaciale]KAI5261916.1 hypothetical protein E4T46_04888 [Aureobasidium subglaciale]
MSYTLISFDDFLAAKIEKCCIGHKQEPKIRCSNTISDNSLCKAVEIWDAIRSGANAVYIERKMVELAASCLCQTSHQMQAATVANSWIEEAMGSGMVQSKIVSQNTIAKTGSDIVGQADQFVSEQSSNEDNHRQQTKLLSQQHQQAVHTFEEAHSSARDVTGSDEPDKGWLLDAAV